MSLSPRIQIIIGLILATLLVLTRSQHFADLHHLPSASWAVFFLVGVYIKSRWGLTAFLSLTFLLDFSVFWSGANSVCFTQAYIMLLPAYAALWMGGHWYAKQHNLTFNRLLLLGSTVFVATFSCELLSSGGYYFLSGIFEPNLSEFASRLVQYYPYSLSSTAFYVTVAAIVHSLIHSINGMHGITRTA
ncbi:MAG: hypothetical protein KAI17_15005 [Thiotrichaceae bacterium]|nr:hypothetical protein [Thiotrichaceae bacterium]